MSGAAAPTRHPHPLARLTGIAATLAEQLARALAARGNDTGALRALTDEQLRDVGIDRASIEPARPTLAVDGALIRRLMSLS